MHLRTLIGALLALASLARAGGFTFDDAKPGRLDILRDGRLVGRYEHAHDTSTPARRNETYKPFLQVFDAAGDAPITKGPGGDFTHHRFAQTVVANHHHRVKRMGQRFQMTALIRREFDFHRIRCL